MAKKQKTPENEGVKTDAVLKPQGGGSVALPSSGFASKIKDLVQYFKDAKTELGKVSWPTKKEVKATSLAVLILVVIMSCFLGIVDLLLSTIVEAILSIGL